MCDTAYPRHTPVLLTTVLDMAALSTGESVLDCTLGLAGHASAFLDRIGPSGTLVGLDADATNLSEAGRVLSGQNVRMVHANFGSLPACLPSDIRSFDLIFADLGLSSPHLDSPERGFSFRGNAPLDMRYDRSQGMTAADVLNRSTKEELTRIFQEYGELPKTHRFVAAILNARDAHPLLTSDDVIKNAQPLYGHTTPKVAPQIFQALRIAVNDELGSLQRLLAAAPSLLRPGGRMLVISYHSLEDRMVKQAFRHIAEPEKDEMTGAVSRPASYALLTKKPVLPSADEIENNPRARSAKLRGVRSLM